MERAISTVSRPSPGAEKKVRAGESAAPPAGGGSPDAKRKRRTRSTGSAAGSAAGAAVSTAPGRRRSAASVRSSPSGTVASVSPARPARAATDVERRLVGDGDVEQNEHALERRALDASRAFPNDPCRGATERRAVHEPGVVEKPGVAPREARDVGAAPVELTRVIDVGVRVAQIAQGRRQRPAERAEVGDRLQIVERLAPGLLEGGVRRHRLHRQSARRSESAAGQVDRRDARGELPQAEPMKPERRAGFRRDVAREIVDRFPGLADEQHLTAAEAAPKRIGRSLDAGLRRPG